MFVSHIHQKLIFGNFLANIGSVSSNLLKLHGTDYLLISFICKSTEYTGTVGSWKIQLVHMIYWENLWNYESYGNLLFGTNKPKTSTWLGQSHQFFLWLISLLHSPSYQINKKTLQVSFACLLLYKFCSSNLWLLRNKNHNKISLL